MITCSDGRGLNPGSMRQTSSLSNLGHFKNLFGMEILCCSTASRKDDHLRILLAIWLYGWHCFWTPFRFVNKNYNIIDFVWLCFIEGNLSEASCIETCSMCLWMFFCFSQFDCVKTKTMSFVVNWTCRPQLRSWTWFQVMLLTVWLTRWHCF